MTALVDHARELIRYSAARKPLLLVPEDKLDQFLQETCGGVLLLDLHNRFDGVPFRCARHMFGDLAVIDMADR